MIKLKSNIIIFFITFFFLFLFWNIDHAFAEEIGKNIILELINKFKEQSSSWYDPIKSAATYLFSLVLFFELAWTSIKAGLQQMSLQDFFINLVMIIFSGCFFLAIINNYQEWSTAIISGLTNIINNNIGNGYKSDDPFNIALTLYDNMQKIIDPMKGLDYIATVLACYLCMLIIMIIFAIITAKVIVIKCEVLIGMLGCLLLIPFGASQTFKEFAINSMKYILSVGFKLFMINLIIAISFTFIRDFTFGEQILIDCLMLVGFSVVLLCICFTLPDTIASLVSSAHGTSGNMLMAMNTVMNTISAGANVVSAGLSVAKNTGGGIGKAVMQGFAARDLAKESMMGRDGTTGKYTDSSKWDSMSKFGKSKAMFNAWNESRGEARANNSTIYKEMRNKQAMIKNLRDSN